MPVKRRLAKRKTLPRPMPRERATADQWHAHREEMLAQASAGTRPKAWWQYDSPKPRNFEMNEALQLYRLGVLTQAEIDALTPFWRQWEEKARSGLPFTRGPNDTLEGEAAYRGWRAWAGIPADLFPPRKPVAKIFHLKGGRNAS